MNSLALTLWSAFVCRSLQEPDVGWHLDQMWVEPTLLMRLYILLVLLSIAVAIAQAARSWFLLSRFSRLHAESSSAVAIVFHRQARALQRWMILNTLGWASATTAELSAVFRGVWVSRTVEMRVVATAVEAVLRPSALLFVTLIILYVARWRILWRAERLDSQR